MSFNLHIADDFFTLADMLSSVTKGKMLGPLESEIIIMQSGAMAEKLTRYIAKEQGVFAGFQLPFPRRFITDMIKQGGFEASIMNRDSLLWTTMQLLTDMQEMPKDLQPFLPQDVNVHCLFSAAGLISSAIDDYSIMRPSLLDSWEDNPEHYQGKIYKSLLDKGLFPLHTLENHLEQGLFPTRINVFGVFYLPPVIMKMLRTISEKTEVNFFYLQSGGISQATGLFADSSPPAEGLYFKKRMMKASNEFLEILKENAKVSEFSKEWNEKNTVLSNFQHHVRQDIKPRKHEISPDDKSVKIVLCHSMMRQVEILKDYLLDDLSENPDRTLSDIAVLLPDIDSFVPYIKAVFDADENKIPYKIAGLSAHQETPVKMAFKALLEIPGSRWERSQISYLLDCPQVAKALELSRSDIDKILLWIEDSSIRWGLDGKHRENIGVPKFEENSWQWGIDRILMGFATNREEFYQDILPYVDIDSASQNAISGLITLYETLLNLHKMTYQDREPAKWAAALRSIVKKIFQGNRPWENDYQDSRDIDAILGAVEQLEKASEYFDGKIPYSVVREYLMLQESKGGGFMSGKLLFAPLLNMRGLPYDVVCILGLNDGVFPRHIFHSPFNEISKEPQKGERNTREDERALFIDTLMCARQRLYLSYSNRSIADDSPKAASVFVDGFVDSLREIYNDVNPLFEKHALHPFDNKYYTGDEFFTYQTKPIIETISEKEVRLFDFEVEPPPLELTPAEFAGFWKNSAEFFCRKIKDIQVLRENEALDDNEPLELNALEQWKIGNELLQRSLNNQQLDEDESLFVGRGVLPLGASKDSLLNPIKFNVLALTNKLRETQEDNFPITFELDGVVIKGNISVQSNNRKEVFIVHYSTRSDKYDVMGFIYHLLLNKLHGKYTTHILCRDDETILRPSQNFEILNQFTEGLKRPLPFFPKESRKFFSSLDDESDKNQVFSDLKWNVKKSFDYTKYHDLCFGEDKPEGQEFADSFIRNAVLFWEAFEKCVIDED